MTFLGWSSVDPGTTTLNSASETAEGGRPAATTRRRGGAEPGSGTENAEAFSEATSAAARSNSAEPALDSPGMEVAAGCEA